MADYTQTTDFSAKDNLPTGNASKVIKGSDVDAELAAISTAIGSKAENATDETISGNWTHSGTTTFSNTVDLGGKATGQDVDLIEALNVTGNEFRKFEQIFNWTTYYMYEFVLNRMTVDTNARNIGLQVGTGTGPTWIQDAGLAMDGQSNGTAFANASSTSFNWAPICGTNIGTTSSEAHISARLTITGGDTTANRVTIHTTAWGQNDSGQYHNSDGILAPVTAGVTITSIRFSSVSFAGWNVSSVHTASELMTGGNIRVYGYRKSE